MHRTNQYQYESRYSRMSTRFTVPPVGFAEVTLLEDFDPLLLREWLSFISINHYLEKSQKIEANDIMDENTVWKAPMRVLPVVDISRP